jgi:hypothetical protein
MRCALRFLQTVSVCTAAVMISAAISVGQLHAQDARPIPGPTVAPRGIPEDWSNRHVVYTRNGSFEDMVKVRDDPRFINSVRLQKAQERLRQAKPLNSVSLSKGKSSKVDWAYSLGHHGGMAIGESPAKYTYDTGTAPPSCSDFAVYTIDTNRVAPAIQGNLVGLTNLYTGTTPPGICTGSGPTTLFSYAIGTNPSPLSPVISLDGTKVAWIESPATGPGNDAILHVTTWVAGQGTNATVKSVAIDTEMNNALCAPAAGTSCDDAIDYTSQPLPGCLTATPYSNNYSDLYVDYGSDSGFIGADNGNLYHISGIFLGTPTFDFCVPVNPTPPIAMSGTVYDSANGVVYISDPTTVYAYSVGATSYTLVKSAVYGNGLLASGPLLDSFDGFVYLFSADQGALPIDDTSMTQFPASLVSASAVTVRLGPATTAAYPTLFFGTFDNNYLNNGPFSASSTLYTCGTDTTNPAAQDLFAISFDPSSGAANTTPAMTANPNVNPGGGNGLCSPIEESFDGTTDRIFVGMGDAGQTDGANVVTMWDVTTQLTNPTTLPTATGTGYLGGTTDFAVDGASSAAQAQSIYFGTLSPDPATGTTICGNNHYCAVKLTQSTLQ